MRVLLTGNPNVGKSAIFSRLTGTDVMVSNYSGTTVEYARGSLKINSVKADLVDLPGTFSLDPTNKAEQVAVSMLGEGDVIVNVADAGNLERSLYLSLQLVQTGSPVILVLNMWDEVKKKKIKIDVEKLQHRLGIPVVTTSAVTGDGISELRSRLESLLLNGKAGTTGPSARRQSATGKSYPHNKYDAADASHSGQGYGCAFGNLPGSHNDQSGRAGGSDAIWSEIDKIISDCQTDEHRGSSIPAKAESLSVHPAAGPLLAFAVLIASFAFVALFGDLLHEIMEDLFLFLWLPVTTWLSEWLGGTGFVHSILVGNLIDGSIDMEESFGLLTTGLFIPFAVVLPFIFCFYVVLSLLEDVGYLPRLGVVVDSIMRKLGIHGLSVVPLMLGVGCNVPGVMAGRMLETKKERFIVATLIAIVVPCMAQQAMVIGLLGQAGLAGLLLVYGTLFLLLLILGWSMNLFLGGKTTEMLIDLPPFRKPYAESLSKKIYMRMNGFIRGALPYVLLGVFVVNIFYTMGIIGYISDAFAPVITGLFGLPGEAGAAMIVGFLRKDVAVGMLVPLGMEVSELIIASVVLMVYFPCVATFVVLFKEIGWPSLLKLIAIMLAIVLFAGGGLNLLLQTAGLWQ